MMATRRCEKIGREPSGNTFKAIVAIAGAEPMHVYRATLSGTYEGAQRLIDAAWDGGSTAEVTVCVFNKPFPKAGWQQVDRQTIPANGTLRH